MNTIEKKIVILGPSLTAVSGVSTHVNLLVKSELSLLYKFFHFQVGSEGVVENFYQKFLRYLTSPFKLFFLLIKERADIIHINTSMDDKAFFRDFSYFVGARILKCKIVNQFHSGSSPLILFNSSVFRVLLRYFLLKSDVVVVLSNEAVKSYLDFDKDIQVVCVPNALDTVDFEDVIRTRPAFSKHVDFVYIGRIIRSKGLFESLQALNILKSEGLRFTFRIAGVGPDLSEIEDLVISLGLSKEVMILGPIFGLAKIELWSYSHIQLFPTYHNEGLPYSILESLAAGCVPITCAVAGISDIITDKVHGVFVPARDPSAIVVAIRYLIDSDENWLKMSAAGRQVISDRYSISKFEDSFSEIYHRLGK